MTVLASTIIDRARNLLSDTRDTKRWSDAELLRYLSDGQRTLAALQPGDAASKRVVVQLVAGTRQSLPADGIQLLSVFRNMGSNGTTPGRVVRLVTRDILDAQNLYWHVDTAETHIQNYIYDPSDSLNYYVYPPSNGLGYVELNYAATPAELVALTDSIALIDIYITPLTDYVMFRAHQKDSDFGAGQVVAQSYLQAFKLFIDGSDAGAKEENPNLQMAPFNPQVKGASK